MELIFESRTNFSNFSGHLNFIQRSPTLHHEPVILPDTFGDRKGASIYGSVLRDGGQLRMWYLAMPEDWDYTVDMSPIAYAESEDGIEWRKVPIDVLKHGPGKSNFTDLSLHSANIFIDPDGPGSHRYRATGCGYKGLFLGNPNITDSGYYTAHSADGLSWELDSNRPRWNSADVITNVYHPQQKRAIVSMKFTPRVNRILRRSIWTAQYSEGRYTDAVSALLPDEFDDVCAVSRGYSSCDYYGMGMMPAGSGTVGFLWNYWHSLPYTGPHHIALFGTCDFSLVYQPGPGDVWQHVPGRPTFIDHRAMPWMEGWINSAGCTVDMGDETWLYYSGTPFSHGFYLDTNWKPTRWAEHARSYTAGGIGIAKWPKYRLFGYQSDPEGTFHIDLGEITAPSELRLNYEVRPGGRIRVELIDVVGRTLDDCISLSSNSIGETVVWKDGTTIAPSAGKRLVAKVHLEIATLYAYEVGAAR